MKLPIHEYIPDASRIILGCMHLGGEWDDKPVTTKHLNQASDIISTALENGINVIDLADIYTYGKAEKTIGELFKRERSLRRHLIIQSKIGIKLSPEFKLNHYDLSSDWITKAVNASIKRLHDNPLDILFLHRPDPLMRLEESAEALNRLHEQGKFEYLAVSNMHAGQVAWLQSQIKAPIIANQLEMSLISHDFVEDAITTNMAENANNGFPRGTIEYCHQASIQLQAWGALAQGRLSSPEAQTCPKIENTRRLVYSLADEYSTKANAIVLAWLLKHPSDIQAVVGSRQASRLIEACEGLSLELSKEHWYALLESIRGKAVP